MQILFESLYIGMRVYDDTGNLGTVMAIDGIHNVWIEFDNIGAGYHCLDEKCHFYDRFFSVSSLKV